MLAWTAPAHPVAPLPENMGVLIPSKPAWFNDPASQAILPDGMQRGDTCGLHAVNTILSSFASLRGHQRPCITKTDFESYALQRNLGDRAHNLVQPCGSNNAVAVLHANLQRHAIEVFPMASSDLESRFVAPFVNHIIPEGDFACAGYLLRLPHGGGHWVGLLPPQSDTTLTDGASAILCDSLDPKPICLRHHEVESLLVACALVATAMSSRQWSCF